MFFSTTTLCATLTMLIAGTGNIFGMGAPKAGRPGTNLERKTEDYNFNSSYQDYCISVLLQKVYMKSLDQVFLTYCCIMII